MQPDDLIAIAREYARRQGWDVDEYAVASITSAEGICWIVFEGRDPRPGNHFSVGVEENTGTVVQLIPGR